MPLDSIHQKPNPTLPPRSRNKKNFLIPLIIIIVIIAIIWLISLKYNFARIDEKTQSQESSPGQQEIDSALQDLSQELDKLKNQKIFSQDESQSEDSEPTEIPQGEPLPAQQY